jgi:hypothetical protein
MDTVTFLIVFALMNGVTLFYRTQIAIHWSKGIVDARDNPQNFADRVFGPARKFDSAEEIERKLKTFLFWSGFINLIGVVIALVVFWIFRESRV